MRDALAEGALLRRDLVEVHVEVVARDAAEGHDVGLGDGAPVRQQRFTDGQLLEVAAEGVDPGLEQRRAAHVLAADRGQHRGRALHRRALQVVRHRAHAAELLAAAGAPRAAVLEPGQRRAMARGLHRRLAVQHQDAAVPGGHGRHHARGRGRLARDERGHQAAAAARGQGHGLVHLVVGHQRAHRAEGLDVVHGGVGVRVGAAQQRGREEGPALHALALRRPARAQADAGAVDHLAARGQLRHARGHVGLLGVRGERAHAHALERRVARHHLGQARGQALGHGVEVAPRHDGAPDRGALLPRLDRHLARDLLDEELELLVVGADVGGQDGAVQRIRLGVERHRARHQVGVHAQARRGVGRAGEGDDVGLGQPVQQVPGAADHQLQAARGQQAAVVHQAHQRLGQVARGGGGLGDAGHAGQEAGRELLQQAPDGEVEGVDVHRHAAPGHQDVRARKHPRLAQRQGRAFMHDVARGQVTRAHAGVSEEGAGAALDVDPAVGARGAGVAREGVERLLALQQVGRQGLEQGRALLEVQLQQRGHAHRAGVVQGLGEIERLGMGVGDCAAVDGAAQQAGGLGADPAVGDEALKDGDSHDARAWRKDKWAHGRGFCLRVSGRSRLSRMRAAPPDPAGAAPSRPHNPSLQRPR